MIKHNQLILYESEGVPCLNIYNHNKIVFY